MPYRFHKVSGNDLKGAPGLGRPEGAAVFQLLDPDGSPVTGEPVEFHVLDGGVQLFANSVIGSGATAILTPMPAEVVRSVTALDAKGNAVVAPLVTDGEGKVSLPRFAYPPEAGAGTLLVRSAQASLEELVIATWSGVVLRLLSPAQPDPERVAGTSLDLKVSAVDQLNGDAPVAGLPLEIEVTEGGAELRTSLGPPGHYDVQRTAYTGRIQVQVTLSCRAETTRIRVQPYWHREIGRIEVQLTARAPRLRDFLAGSHTLGATPVLSVADPLRWEVSDSPDAAFSADDRDIDDVVVLARSEQDFVEIHPPQAESGFANHSFLVWPDTALATPTAPATSTPTGTRGGTTTGTGGTTTGGSGPRGTTTTGNPAPGPGRPTVLTGTTRGSGGKVATGSGTTTGGRTPPTGTGTTAPNPVVPTPTTPSTSNTTTGPSERYDLRAWLPDYPDAEQLDVLGTVWDPLSNGGLVREFAGSPGVYARTGGGGDEDTDNKLRVRLQEGGLQYRGPSQVSKRIRLGFEVLDATYGSDRERVVEVRFKLKCRATPHNTRQDDPTANPWTASGGVSESVSGPWEDALEVTRAGLSPGPYHLDFHARSNARNFDELVDITARVKVERLDEDGAVIDVVERATEIHVRCAGLRPRLSLVRQHGADFVPMEEGAVLPVTVFDRTGRFTRPPGDRAFFVELRCHDQPGDLSCTLLGPGASPQSVTLSPTLAAGGPYQIYRSKPCFVAVDDPMSGPLPLQPGALPPDIVVLMGRPGGRVSARMTDEMPKNTESQAYRSGERPVSTCHLVTVGDAASRDRLPTPWMHVEVDDGGCWSAALDPASGQPLLQLTVRVRDPLAELDPSAGPAEIRVNGQPFPLKPDLEAKSFGRPQGWRGVALASVPVRLGVQTVTVEARNSAGGVLRQRFRVLVDDRRGDRIAPRKLFARARRLCGPMPPLLPELIYLHARCSPAAEGQTLPAVQKATLWGLPPYPSGAHTWSLFMNLRRRPTEAPCYTSEVGMAVRRDLVPSGGSVPRRVLYMEEGGRIEWDAIDLFNARGPWSLQNRISRPVARTFLDRLDADGNWQPAERVRVGDTLRVRVRTTPLDPQPILPTYVTLNDPAGQPTLRPDRQVWARCRAAGGEHVMAAWMRPGVGERPADRIVVIAESDPEPTSGAWLRLAGDGRLFAGLSPRAGLADVDLPAAAVPRRDTRDDAAGDPIAVPQEGLFSTRPRLGALDAVVPGSGELVLEAADRSWIGRGEALELRRTHRAFTRFDGPLGRCWHPSWDVRCWRRSPDEVELLTSDGQVVSFWRGNAGWDCSPGATMKLVEAHEGLDILLPQGERLTFGPAGEEHSDHLVLIEHADRFGNRTLYRFGRHGRLLTLEDTLRQEVQLLWEQTRYLLRRVGDACGSAVDYEIAEVSQAGEPRGELLRVLAPEQPSDRLRKRRTTSFAYTDDPTRPRLLRVQDPFGNDPYWEGESTAPALDEWLLQVDYDSEGRVTTQVIGAATGTSPPGWAFIWPADDGDPLTWTDPKGHERTVHFEQDPPEGFARLPTRSVTTVDDVELEESFVYNFDGAIYKHIQPLGDAVHHDFRASASDPRDRANLLEISLRPRGGDGARYSAWTTRGETDFTKRATARRIRSLREEQLFNDLQLPERTQDSLGRVTLYEYQGPFLVKETLPPAEVGQVRERHYVSNHWGQLLEERDALGVVTRYLYYPEADPMGQGFGSGVIQDIDLVSAPETPTGLLARVIRDASPAHASRAAHLAPARPVQETLRYDRYGNLRSCGVGLKEVCPWVRTYNGLGELIEEVGFRGGRERYVRDANGRAYRLEEWVVDENSDMPDDLKEGFGVVTQTGFDREGRAVKRVVDVGGLNLTTTWAHDANGNLELQTSPLAHADPANHGLNTIRYRYDAADRLIEQIHAEGAHDELGSPRQLSRAYRYDDDGLLIGVDWPTGRTLDITRDRFGRVERVEDGEGNERSFRYDEEGNLTRADCYGSVDGGGWARGALASVTFYRDLLGRQVATRSDAFAFDRSMRKHPQDPGYVIEQHDLDAAGNLLLQVTPTGARVERTWDGHGALVGMTQRAFDGAPPVLEVSKVLDDWHHPTRIARAVGIHTQTITLNVALDGELRERRVDGVLSGRWLHDSRGRLRFAEDPYGNRVMQVYDNADRLRETWSWLYHGGRRILDGVPQEPEAALIQLRDYDENDNLVGLSWRHERGSIVSTRQGDRLEYDPANQLRQRVVVAGGEDPASLIEATWTCGYHPDGTLARLRDPLGRVLIHTYDDAGRLKAVEKEAWTGPSDDKLLDKAESRAFAWDGLGRLVRWEDSDGTRVLRLLDTQGRVCLERIDVAGAAAETVTATRSADGRQVSLVYPEHDLEDLQIDEDRDALGRLLSVSDGGAFIARFAYEGLSPKVRTDASGRTLTVRRYADGQPARVESGLNGGRDFFAEYTYDARGLLEQAIASGDGTAAQARATRFRYDSLGQLKERLSGFGVTFTSTVNAQGQRYVLDPGTAPEQGQIDVYDPWGNRVTSRSGAIADGGSWATGWDLELEGLRDETSTYDEADQLHRWTLTVDGERAESGELFYNLKSQAFLVLPELNTLAFDGFGRLREVTSSGSGAAPVPYRYDALGRLVRRADERFLWFGDQLLAHVRASGRVHLMYAGDQGGLVALDRVDPGATRRFFVGGTRLRSIETLHDASGLLVERYVDQDGGLPQVLDADGDPIAVADQQGNPFRQDGLLLDPTLQGYLIGPRAFHCVTGRFLQPDPRGPEYDPLARGNRFAFAGNNAVNLSDDGFIAVSTAFAIGLLVRFVLIPLLLSLLETWIETEVFGDGWDWSVFGRNFLINGVLAVLQADSLKAIRAGVMAAKFGRRAGTVLTLGRAARVAAFYTFAATRKTLLRRLGLAAVEAGARVLAEYTLDRFVRGTNPDLATIALGTGGVTVGSPLLGPLGRYLSKRFPRAVGVPARLLGNLAAGLLRRTVPKFLGKAGAKLVARPAGRLLLRVLGNGTQEIAEAASKKYVDEFVRASLNAASSTSKDLGRGGGGPVSETLYLSQLWSQGLPDDLPKLDERHTNTGLVWVERARW
ncbi:MAG: RHS repeat protein [Alphaproteobacteria bacterium]|nr:RHS repeat protein [Alphaproteobacteria bacterium]